MGFISNTTSHYIVLIIFCFLLYFTHLGNSFFFNKGETREALVVQNIVFQGNWIFPLRVGNEIPSKPPLFHWSSAIVSSIMGEVNEFTVRFPSAFFASLGIFSIYWFGRRLFNPETAFLSAIILSTFMGYQRSATSARVDMTLIFFLTISLILFYCLYQNYLKNSLWVALFHIILGVSVLAKGPVSLILFTIISTGFFILNMQWSQLYKIFCRWTFLITILLPLLWYIFAYFKLGQDFFNHQIIHENIARFFYSGEEGTGHQKPYYYYVLYLFSQGLPWSLLLPFIFINYIKDWRSHDNNRLFLIIWVLSVFLFFSLSSGKRSPYILPLYPPLSILIASWLLSKRRWLKYEIFGFRLIALCSLIAAMFLIASILGIFWGNDPVWFINLISSALKKKDQANLMIIKEIITQQELVFIFIILSLSTFWIILSRYLWFLQLRSSIITLTIISLLLGFFINNFITPSLAKAKSYAPFMKRVNHFSKDKQIFLVRGDFDPGLVYFYGRSDIVVLDEQIGDYLEIIQSEKLYLVMSEDRWETYSRIYSTKLKVIFKSVGTGPDGNMSLVLAQGLREVKP